MKWKLNSAIVAVTFVCTVASVQAFSYGTDKIRGVSLGGWLLLEPFITPSIFKATGDPKVVDEFTYGAKYGSEEAGRRLRNHWDTFITEADIIKIKAYGLNHVRIPIGFWSIRKEAGEPYPVGAYPYVKKAVDWSKKHGVKVLLDLHGVPGSQNGFDNSGRRGGVEWYKYPNNVRRTREILKVLIDDFVVNPNYRDVVTSIQPVNEPAGFQNQDILPVLKQYYYDAYGALRYPFGDSGQVDTLLSLSDAFQNPTTYWQGFMPWNSGAHWSSVALDTHPYTIFSDYEARYTYQQRIDVTCQKVDLMTKGSLWTYAGEWSPATTDCAGSTNIAPAAIGSFYDGTHPAGKRVGNCEPWTGSGAKFSPAFKTFLRQYWETQVNVYEQGIGWIMWTWKTEVADEWSYVKGVEYGWIPTNPTERKYPDLCKTRLLASRKLTKRGQIQHSGESINDLWL